MGHNTRQGDNCYEELKGTDWTYRDIADFFGLDKEKFQSLMKERFDGNGKEGKDFHLSYSIEWAERVNKNDHFRYADSETEKALKEAGYTKPVVNPENPQTNRVY